MKSQKTNVSSQVLIVILAALVMIFMLQVAQAQALQAELPQKSLVRKLMDNTSLGYYNQFLGPTVAGKGGETYNVFQESRSPYQSFHAAILRYQLNPDWSFGASIAAVNAYGDTVTNQQSGFQSNTKVRDEFFNARAFITTPAFKSILGTLFTTVSYEVPTSVFAKENNQQYGLVLAQSFAFPIPSTKWTSGLMWQYYRMVFNKNVEQTRPADFYFPGSVPEYNSHQTVIFSGGPYLAYRHNDNWGMNTSMTFDWDQRGNQTGTTQFNNNLPDRARLGVSYFPTKYKQIANVGIFTQSLIKYTANTQALGGEFSLKF